MPSRDAEQARLVRALAGEVETVLREVAGVLAARVLLSLPDPAPLATAEPAAPRAGVVVRYRAPDGEGPPITEDAVRRLAAAAVVGLRPNAVKVVFSRELPSSAASGAPHVLQVGPFLVARESRVALVAVVGGLAALTFLLSLWIVRRSVSRPGARRGTPG